MMITDVNIINKNTELSKLDNCNNYSGEINETNCEKWRIIGYMKDKSRVKIIRAEVEIWLQRDSNGRNFRNRSYRKLSSFRTSYDKQQSNKVQKYKKKTYLFHLPNHNSGLSLAVSLRS